MEFIMLYQQDAAGWQPVTYPRESIVEDPMCWAIGQGNDFLIKGDPTNYELLGYTAPDESSVRVVRASNLDFSVAVTQTHSIHDKTLL
jgi:hypothetical protein